METATAPPSVLQGRLCILAAALMWSTSGAFTKVLTQPTGWQLHEPPIAPLQIAFYRAMFAALTLLPLLRRGDISFRPVMLPMVACFAIMNVTFVAAMALGTAADAIVLQYTAPMWMTLACVYWLGEPADRRSLVAFVIAFIGIVAIVAGSWTDEQLPIVGLGLTSGITYAGVLVCLRVLQDASSRWLIALNHLISAAVLVPFVWQYATPTNGQMLVLVVYGGVQMAIPYWLVARGVRAVSPQEAGTIALFEPLLNPLWAWVISREVPTTYTLIGGAFILGALIWRYWPVERRPIPSQV